MRGTGAALAVSSAVLHASSPTPWTAVMAAACLYCAYEVWRFDTVRSWVLVAVMNLAMIAVHLPLAGHRHGDATAGEAPMGTAMQLATAVAATEIVFAAIVLYRLSLPGARTVQNRCASAACAPRRSDDQRRRAAGPPAAATARPQP
ncbi:hypothetical protein [Mycolicibacterium parafortuitum]|uniref:hypothetical protein n=1 Tax=Mycolicibacterium parafortuitum TaxID=39692 RepID=UPI001F256894|nr:hypothetical protein [Mycolicibacterium parafortuitum]